MLSYEDVEEIFLDLNIQLDDSKSVKNYLINLAVDENFLYSDSILSEQEILGILNDNKQL